MFAGEERVADVGFQGEDIGWYRCRLLYVGVGGTSEQSDSFFFVRGHVLC